MTDILSFILENQESMLHDMYPHIKSMMDYAYHFKGKHHETYLDNVRLSIKEYIHEFVKQHYLFLPSDELLMILQDSLMEDFVSSTQEYFIKEAYRVDKNTLH